MLQSMREGTQSTPAKIVIFLIVIAFAGFGIESVLVGGSGTAVAEVNGTEISPIQLQVAIDNQKRRLAQMLGEQLDPALLEDDRLRPSALEGLIEREVLLQESDELGLSASSRAIGRVVAEIEAFQVDGQFDADQFKVVLANNGYTPERFRRSEAQNLILTQLQDGVIDSEFTTSTELAAAVQVIAEERDVRFLLLDGETLAPADAITDAEIEAFYADHMDDYVSPERVLADYIELSVQDFIQPVDESLVEEQFEQVKSEYRVADQSRVSHILLIAGADEAPEQYASRIDTVAARIASGEDFAALAAELSDDIGSAASGGDLGFTDGTAFPEAMEEAIAELAVSEVSGPVETDAGTHFIRLEERAEGQVPDYDTIRSELAESIQRSEAQQSLLLVVEELRDLSFNAVDLSGPAAALDLSVQRSEAVTAEQGEGIFATAAVRSALFAEDVKVGGNNSAVVELGEGRFVVARVAETLPQEQLPLTAVSDDIRAVLAANALEDALEAMLEEVEAELVVGTSLEAIAKARDLEWRVELGARRQSSLLPREVAAAAFGMMAGESNQVQLARLPAGQFALVQLAAVRAGAEGVLSEAEVEALAFQLANSAGQLSLREYRDAVRADADVVVR